MEDIINGAQYNFLQLMHLLEQHGLPPPKLIPAKSLSFPASDIKKCSKDEHNNIIMELNFMGLYGVDSPLPHYFSEYVHKSHNNCLADFLNIFNNRIYHLFYLIWKKYHSSYPQYLKALSNIGKRHHNCNFLAGQISDFLDGAEVSIKQFIPRWVALDNIMGLGNNNMRLGDNTILGENSLTTTQKISIQIYTSLDYSKYQQLKYLISQYTGPRMIFSITFISPNTKLYPILGLDNIRLI